MIANSFSLSNYLHKFIAIALISCLLCCLIACDSRRVYDTFSPIGSSDGWKYDKVMRFEIPIMDTVQHYNIYTNVRHTNDFPYSNLWVKINTVFPSGKKVEGRVNLPLADKSGKWYGSGSGDIFTIQVPIQESAKMPELGTYRFELIQDMRMNPLTNILDVGVRVERASP